MKKGTQVLIVDDDPMVREMTQGMLEDVGLNVVGKAVNGWQALELTQSLKPDVVLMDLEMPEMSGIQATQKIQEICPTPVVVLTAYEHLKAAELASEAGVGAYLVKPPNPYELERAIIIASARFNDMMALRRLNDQLRSQNEDLDAFGHMVAHNLKNLLVTVTGYSRLLTDEDQLSDEIKEAMTVICRNGVKMTAIIDELLVFASIRDPNVQLTSISMTDIVAEALQRLADKVEGCQAQITLTNTWPMALGYAPWVEEVWANYICNAIKYGGRPPHLKFGATECLDGMIKFWIQDNGIGLTPAEQKRLFRPFTRLERVDVKGHGLGLSIVQRIIEKLGGQVGVESEGIPGKGSRFFFTLPPVTGLKSRMQDR